MNSLDRTLETSPAMCLMVECIDLRATTKSPERIPYSYVTETGCEKGKRDCIDCLISMQAFVNQFILIKGEETRDKKKLTATRHCSTFFGRRFS